MNDMESAPETTGKIDTAEAWATAKGMLPQFTRGGEIRPNAHAAGVVSFGGLGDALASVAPRHNPKYVMFYRTKVLKRWPNGAEMTESEFDAAVEEAANVTHG
jgi:hypothetical protein